MNVIVTTAVSIEAASCERPFALPGSQGGNAVDARSSRSWGESEQRHGAGHASVGSFAASGAFAVSEMAPAGEAVRLRLDHALVMSAGPSMADRSTVDLPSTYPTSFSLPTGSDPTWSSSS